MIRLRVLSLGAGVQSTTMALMATAGELTPMPDAAIFADTQWEPEAVYRQLDWLREPGRLAFPVIVATAGDIKAGILARRTAGAGRYAAVPWFNIGPDGTPGIGRRQCTSEYKLLPIMRATRALLGVGRRDYIAKATVEVWVGISRDEASRMKPARAQWMINRWPLIERDLTRADCLAWLARHGHPEPPKSACVGCPFRRDREWIAMRATRPTEWAEAVAVDAALRVGDSRGINATEFMHDTRLPLPEAIDLVERERREQPNLFENECEGMCGV
jgi:hypothetical protein